MAQKNDLKNESKIRSKKKANLAKKKRRKNHFGVRTERSLPNKSFAKKQPWTTQFLLNLNYFKIFVNYYRFSLYLFINKCKSSTHFGHRFCWLNFHCCHKRS